MDDSDRAVSNNAVIPAKAGIQPRLVGLITAVGLLVLVGAGCTSKTVPDEPVAVGAVHPQGELLPETKAYVLGIESACYQDLEHAEQIFKTNRADFSPFSDQVLRDALKKQTEDGWSLAQICIEKAHVRNGVQEVFYFTLRHYSQLRIGFWESSEAQVLFSDIIETNNSTELNYLRDFHLTYKPVSSDENRYKVIGMVWDAGPDPDVNHMNYIRIYELDPSTNNIEERNCGWRQKEDLDIVCNKFF